MGQVREWNALCMACGMKPSLSPEDYLCEDCLGDVEWEEFTELDPREEVGDDTHK